MPAERIGRTGNNRAVEAAGARGGRANGSNAGVGRRREARGAGVGIRNGDGSTVERGVVGAGVRGRREARGGVRGRRRRAGNPQGSTSFADLSLVTSLLSDYDELMANRVQSGARTYEPHPSMPLPDFGTLAPPPRPRPPFAGRFRCHICSQNYLDREPTAVPQCGHIFCAECLTGESGERCPQCSEAYDPSTLTRIYIN